MNCSYLKVNFYYCTAFPSITIVQTKEQLLFAYTENIMIYCLQIHSTIFLLALETQTYSIVQECVNNSVYEYVILSKKKHACRKIILVLA